MLKKPFIALAILAAFAVQAQESIETKFYRFLVPINTEIVPFNGSNEDLANIDGFKLSQGNNLKYIFYLMSNKLNYPVDNVDSDNYKDFISDLGDIEVVSVDSQTLPIKVTFNYIDNAKVTGVLYISTTNDILNRFVFVLPNLKNVNQKYESEITNLIKNITHLKTTW